MRVEGVEALTENHQRRLRVHCQHIDKLLSDIEAILHASEGASVFPRYLPDLSLAQTRTIESYVQQLRARLLEVLAWQGMQPQEPAIPASRAVKVNLAFVEIAIEELKPKYMRGSGEIPQAALVGLNGAVQELNSTASRMTRFMEAETGPCVESRSRGLETVQASRKEIAQHLILLERIISSHALVQYRNLVQQLITDVEEANYQIAFFGRVSSGKSSLLNALLETDVLAVGVNPVTAVPTRLEYAARAQLRVSFNDGRDFITDVHHIADYSTEALNANNAKRVARLTVQLPLARLKQGLVFVDTPGLGSLAQKRCEGDGVVSAIS